MRNTEINFKFQVVSVLLIVGLTVALALPIEKEDKVTTMSPKNMTTTTTSSTAITPTELTSTSKSREGKFLLWKLALLYGYGAYGPYGPGPYGPYGPGPYGPGPGPYGRSS